MQCDGGQARRMESPFSLRADPHGFVLTRDAVAMGCESELRAELAAGRLERVRVGVYRRAGTAARYPNEQHAELARAAAHSLAKPIFTAHSAAALLGLPILSSQWPDEVDLLSPRRTGSKRRGVREIARLAETELIEVEGVTLTSVELTLVQLCRVAPFLDSLAAVDAALRVPQHPSDPPALTSRDRLLSLHERLLPYRGSRKVAAVLEHATELSGSPLETGSRMLIVMNGFEAPVLQHRFELRELGCSAHLDFYWPSVNAGAEADGRGKYLGATAEASAATVIREKDRENALRRRLSAFDRWDWSDFRARTPVLRRLESLGIPRRAETTEPRLRK
ncbi:hypothetical protein ACFVTX_02270 [Agromyces sp. NPDC058136]|uniref:hypothetical protein n=1 Tax=Agromyces sp. NPDC058136 TaxID=3346354 RepID=UPI0036DD46EE